MLLKPEACSTPDASGKCKKVDKPLHHLIYKFVMMISTRLAVFTTFAVLAVVPLVVAPVVSMEEELGYIYDNLKRPPCRNTPTPPRQWACQDSRLQFPTVECIKKDMLTCGLVNESDPLFASFGASHRDLITFSSKVRHTQFVSFYNMMGPDWCAAVLPNPKYTMKDGSPRELLFNIRLGQAFASVCRGNAFLIIPSLVGLADIVPALRDEGFGRPFGKGAFRYPYKAEVSHMGFKRYNIWRDFEFPALQRNEIVRLLVSVVSELNFQPHLDWFRGDKTPLLPFVDADALPVPPVDDTWKD